VYGPPSEMAAPHHLLPVQGESTCLCCRTRDFRPRVGAWRFLAWPRRASPCYFGSCKFLLRPRFPRAHLASGPRAPHKTFGRSSACAAPLSHGEHVPVPTLPLTHLLACRTSIPLGFLAVYPADSGKALPIAWRGGGQLGHETSAFPRGLALHP
jgi:hypothetical protein